MTPKERAIAALNLQQPDKVPTMEIDFQLHRELIGKNLILGKELGKLMGKEKEKALQHNAQIYVETAIELDYSAITVHPPAIECSPGYIPPWSYPDFEDELKVISLVYKYAEDRFMVAMGIDGTYSIPDGKEYLDFVYSLVDEPEEKIEEAENRVNQAVEIMKRMIAAGAQVMYNCSDYCFNKGPFLSPQMFEKFIYPFLKKQTEALKAEGAYVIKHTDGNIIPVIDMLIDAGPHALHSIDPVAMVDIGEIKQKYGSKICIMGNVNTAKLQLGTEEEIIESAEYALKCGMPGGGYIYSSCNAIFEGIPLKNYMTMLKVRERLGTYSDLETSRCCVL
jgi:uroporphyrinogen decarboxylase